MGGTPKPKPQVVAPVVAPLPETPVINPTAAKVISENQRQRASTTGGTILTSPQGLTLGAGNTAKKTLLGV